MKLTNTHISKDCTRKCLVYVDKNGHYHIERYLSYIVEGDFPIQPHHPYWDKVQYGKSKFKHIESANRAVAKWLSPLSS